MRIVRRQMSVLLGLAVGALGLSAWGGPVVADTRPTAPNLPATVSAKPLPTAQMNGVAWSQAVIGNTVYVAGDFSAARPAGSAPGQNQVTRRNLLAYNLTTGNLVTSWAPSTNAPVFAIKASPDGRRLYIGGSFTQVNGSTRNRIAALDPTTGALVSGFNPNLNATVYAIETNGSTVWFGGLFTIAATVTRSRLAAVRASDGALLAWAPRANGRVRALALSPDGTQVLAGGAFTTMNGSSNPGYGLASVDSVNGTLRPWAANSRVRDAGTNSAITSLYSDGTGSVYATGYVYGGGGNLEGTAKMSWNGGAIQWIEDCHGDSYGAFFVSSVLYVVGHPHYCGNMDGGFPQTQQPWRTFRSVAFTSDARGTLKPDYLGYPNWAGQPAPALLQWFPNLVSGTYTGQGQAAWTVAGNSSYVAVAGEFPQAGSIAQQGLARFARVSVDPATSPLEGTTGTFAPTVRAIGSGEVLVSWATTWDRDNRDLTYRVIRNNQEATPITVRTIATNEWERPDQGFIDTGLTPGSSVTYRIIASDGTGNVVRSFPASTTVTGGASAGAYPRVVGADGPKYYWRFSETSGTDVADWTRRAPGRISGNVTRGAPGVLAGDASATFNGSATMYGTASARNAPFHYSVEAWFRTTSTRGGQIVGYGNAQTTPSTNGQYDRQLYLDSAGRVNFNTRQHNQRPVLTSAGAFNNGQWHHAVGVVSEAGMKLYVDGVLVRQRSDGRVGLPYWGYWRVGGDNLSGWANDPPSDYFSGSIDEVAVYSYPLTAAQVSAHFAAARG